MITQPQAPRRNPVHGPYVRVAVADLVEGNRYIYGEEPVVGTVRDLDLAGAGVPADQPARPGYRWVNGEQRERRSWRDVLVASLTQDQRDEILERCQGCEDAPTVFADHAHHKTT